MASKFISVGIGLPQSNYTGREWASIASCHLNIRPATLWVRGTFTVVLSVSLGTMPSAFAYNSRAFLKSRQASLFLPSQTICKRKISR